jgi:hypothetical protein
MMIETLLVLALTLAETAIQPQVTKPDPPLPVCSEYEGELTCYPIDLQEKDYR